MTDKITGTIKNARKESWGDVTVICGNMYGDTRHRFADGEPIHTSYIVSEDGDIITTRNSVYKVEWA